jgi:hypothetical protein
MRVTTKVDPVLTPQDQVASEIAQALRSQQLTIPMGLRETGLFERVDVLHKAGYSWSQIGKLIGWSPINLRECYVLEGGIE